MDWQRILENLTAARLAKLGSNAGLKGASRLRKAELVEALGGMLDDALRYETLAMLSSAELRAIASAEGVAPGASRKRELLHALLAGPAFDDETVELELGDTDILMPDRERRDLPTGQDGETPFEILPSRPGGAESTIYLEVQELLRRASLNRAVLVSHDCRSTVLERLLGEGLDDFIESAARRRPSGDVGGRGPRVTFVLDGEAHALGHSLTGQRLASLALELAGEVEIRLAPRDFRLHAKVFVFEEDRPEGSFLTGILGSSDVSAIGLGAAPGRHIEANVRLAGSLDAVHAALLKQWADDLVAATRPVSLAELSNLAAQGDVQRKARYKRDFDTSHELRLRYLAEQLCRRGRLAGPMFDPSALAEPPEHQRLAVARSSAPFFRGALLLDEEGLGKTVEVGLVLARELRRRRIFASDKASELRRALVVAPSALHDGWREELHSKFALRCEVMVTGHPLRRERELAHWQGSDSQIVVVSPELFGRNWEDLQGFEILVVDECHAVLDPEALAAVRRSAELCLVASGSALESDELLRLAAVVAPEEGFDSLRALEVDWRQGAARELLRQELSSLGAQALRRHLFGEGRLAQRELVDAAYGFDPIEFEVRRALATLRGDYQSRGGHATASAFVALEQALSSSPQAFHALSCRIIGEGGPSESDYTLAEPGRRSDGSFEAIRRSPYFRRRLRDLRERLAPTSAPGAPVSRKERAFLEVLAGCEGERVLVFSRFRATQERLGAILAERARGGDLEQLHGSSSLRERTRILSWFASATSDPSRRQPGWPAGVLLCTDPAAEGLSLQRCCSVLVHYDLPWNPQLFERRVGRLQRWGQRRNVKVVSLVSASVADSAESPGMDARVLAACRRLGLGEPTPPRRDRLFSLDPGEIEAAAADGRLDDLLGAALPDPPATSFAPPPSVRPGDAARPSQREPAALFAPTGSRSERVAMERLREHDRRYRAVFADFWERVSFGRSNLEMARGYLFGRLRGALLQGQVGIVCAPGREPAACTHFDVALTARLLFEAALAPSGASPLDDQWLIEDEELHVWAVGDDGQVDDWQQALLQGGFVEVAADTVPDVLPAAVVDFLAAQKRRSEARALDATPLSEWTRGAPPALGHRLLRLARHAAEVARARERELVAEWEAEKAQRLATLAVGERFVAARGEPERPAHAFASATAAARREELDHTTPLVRHEVLAAQLFVVLH